MLTLKKIYFPFINFSLFLPVTPLSSNPLPNYLQFKSSILLPYPFHLNRLLPLPHPWTPRPTLHPYCPTMTCAPQIAPCSRDPWQLAPNLFTHCDLLNHSTKISRISGSYLYISTTIGYVCVCLSSRSGNSFYPFFISCFPCRSTNTNLTISTSPRCLFSHHNPFS